MNFPKFESDGSWSLAIRPNTPPIVAKLAGKQSGLFHIKSKVLKMKHTFKKIRNKVVAVAAGSVAAIESASAALPADVTTALTDGKADGVTLAGGALVIVIAVAAFKLMRRGV